MWRFSSNNVKRQPEVVLILYSLKWVVYNNPVVSSFGGDPGLSRQWQQKRILVVCFCFLFLSPPFSYMCFRRLSFWWATYCKIGGKWNCVLGLLLLVLLGFIECFIKGTGLNIKKKASGLRNQRYRLVKMKIRTLPVGSIKERKGEYPTTKNARDSHFPLFRDNSEISLSILKWKD